MSILDLLFLNFWFTGFGLVVLPTAVWVLVDASTLKVRKGNLGGGFFDMGVAGWFFSCLFLWIVAFPAYLAKRGEYKQRLLSPEPAASETGYSKCPDCAELIREDARKCRFCGLVLPERMAAVASQIRSAEEGYLPQPGAAVTPKIHSGEEERTQAQDGQAKGWIGIVLAVLIALLIFGSLALNRP